MWSGTVGIGTLSEMNGYCILSDLISPHVLARLIDFFAFAYKNSGDLKKKPVLLFLKLSSGTNKSISLLTSGRF